MVKKWLSRLGAVLAAGVMVCSVYAEQATASFFLRPEEGAQGDTIWYELVYDSGTHSTAGAAFYFNLEPGVSVQQVLPGADVEKAEISYNSTGQELVLLYVDEDGGLSVPEQGAQMFRVALKNSFSENLFPFRVEKTDVCAALDNLDVIPVEATLQMKNLQGEQQNITPAQPAQEESVQEQGQAASPQSNASGSSSVAQASSAAPSETNSNAGHSQTAGGESAAQGALAEQMSQAPSSAAQESISQGQSEAASVLAQTSGNQALLLGIAVPLICIAVGIAVVAMQKYRRKR